MSAARATPSSSCHNEDSKATLYNLLLMVVDPRENAAPIHKNITRSELSRAWRGRVIEINEVSPNLFLARFHNQGDMMHDQNLIIELYEPCKPRETYKFTHMYTTIRLYGIHRNLRTEERTRQVISHIGQPPDLHRLNVAVLDYDEFYVPVKVKINVNKRASDQIILNIPNIGKIIVFVDFEKVRRICTYCAAFFHNAEHCLAWTSKIMSLAIDGEPNSESFGQWIKIPMHLITTQYDRL